jgi:hypothetical protein
VERGGKIVTTIPTVADVTNVRDIVTFKEQKWAFIEADDGFSQRQGSGWVLEKLVVCWMHG